MNWTKILLPYEKMNINLINFIDKAYIEKHIEINNKFKKISDIHIINIHNQKFIIPYSIRKRFHSKLNSLPNQITYYINLGSNQYLMIGSKSARIINNKNISLSAYTNIINFYQHRLNNVERNNSVSI